ncbi:MAG: hypothetical protein NC310_06660 [Roseburia sp.]|nr:hypothetical protein [Anaeroplasma bactoclasticum]MCM1196730.1 hypothetical protein [Roseburia sp.]MCM1557008.1 hypothetical protein [Anaeroplasma bactoclasticum]
MKKIMRVLFLGILFALTSCVYLGLSSKEVKKHNEKIVEQFNEFPLDTYIGFYYFKEEDGLSVDVQFSSSKEGLEFFIVTDDEIYYTDTFSSKKFGFESKEESILDEKCPYYEEAYTDILDIIEIVSAFDGVADKTSGRRGVEKVAEDILDEVTYYYYNMDWKYSDTAMYDFYVSSQTSQLYYFMLRDISNDGGFGKPHFNIHFDKELDRNLYDEYESYKKSILS